MPLHTLIRDVGPEGYGGMPQPAAARPLLGYGGMLWSRLRCTIIPYPPRNRNPGYYRIMLFMIPAVALPLPQSNFIRLQRTATCLELQTAAVTMDLIEPATNKAFVLDLLATVHLAERGFYKVAGLPDLIHGLQM